MATTSNNNYKKGLITGFGCMQHEDIPVNNATFPINQGDLVWWDNTAKIAKVVTSDADAEFLLGAAAGASKVSSNIDSSTEPAINVLYGGIHTLKTTAAQTYDNGTAVYVGADAQTVTTVAGGFQVGVVRLPLRGTPVTGATGVTIAVQVYSRAFVAIHE